MLFWNKNRITWTEDVSKAMHYSSHGAAAYLLGPTSGSSGHLGNWGIKPLKAKYGDLDEYNEYEDGKVANFTFNEVAEIDKEDYYIITYSLEDGSESQKYAVSCSDGSCHKVSGSDGSYHFK